MTHFPTDPIPQEEIDAMEPPQKPDPAGWWILGFAALLCVAVAGAIWQYL